MCVIKELYALQLPYPLYSDGIAPSFIFFCFPAVSDGTAKVGIFSGLPKKFLKFFWLSFSGFRVQLPLNPSFFMAASSGAARPPLRSGAKIETFGTNFQDFCAYFFRFCPNPLDRWTIVFETGGSGTAEQGPQGRAEAKISAESIRLSRMLSGCRAEQKPPGAGRSSAGPQRAEQILKTDYQSRQYSDNP